MPTLTPWTPPPRLTRPSPRLPSWSSVSPARVDLVLREARAHLRDFLVSTHNRGRTAHGSGAQRAHREHAEEIHLVVRALDSLIRDLHRQQQVEPAETLPADSELEG